jgi:polysaccharide pyruvyl transferase WcaK-like protein
MIIEVEGVRFNNKGSELMLRAILHEVRGWKADVRVAVTPRDPYEQRAAAGVWTKVDLGRFGPLQGPLRRAIPATYRRRFGVVIPEEVDAVLDASGFRYSDQWGAATARNLVPRVRAARRAGQPYVLLPQAFGPFRDEGARTAFATAMEDVALVFARDADSYEHVRGAIGDDSRLVLSPDFTAVVPAGPPAELDVPEGRPLAAVVPNYRMIDKTDPATAERYRAFMRAAIPELERAGFQPVLVVHSTEAEDVGMARELAAAGAGPVPVLEEAETLRLKGFIGRCELLVGSRFHALVNALAQGVPCVGTGWSHKYQRLFEQYGSDAYLADMRRPTAEGIEVLRRMLEPGERDRVRERLDAANARLRGEIRAMWTRVRGVLPGASPSPAPGDR